MLLAQILLLSSCSRTEALESNSANLQTSAYNELASTEQVAAEGAAEHVLNNFLADILADAGIPEHISVNILEKAVAGPAFIIDTLTVLQGDPYLRLLVDKKYALSSAYEPRDLVELTAGGSFTISRAGHRLREVAVVSLEEMAAAARVEGITLMASSAYRSYAYQLGVYERNVKQMGQEETDRVSARAGHSQHQLGLALDFGSIDDSFAQTAAGRWLKANASRFGWSLSYPQGYEEITGYRWESWHFRYVGKDLANYIDTYFTGIQQYALQFLYTWERVGGL